ncbi:MAG TPA: alanyl-tRNA editing protein, partial [Polyangiaceae bacterium]|nr:alanyl-tRNA editing protein [Polyangiaceae bacterium]
MTERLYYTDSYLTQFNAQVLDYDAARRRLYLDQTAFYPTSGGQQFDTGTLSSGGSSSLVVVDVVDEGERIAHVLAEEAPALAAGKSVAGQIDWARRFDHMQQHTGQHLLSAVFQELLGLGTLSVHFGAESSTLDLEAAALDPEQIRTLEERANAMVFENREVSAAIEDAAQVSGLRKASTRTGALRVVSIAGLDRSACGGTHVRRTGEIGPILLRRLDRVRKNVRIEFLCGGRATKRARADYEALSRLSGLLSTSIDELPALLSTRLGEFAQQSKQLRDLGAQLDELRARELYTRARAARSSDADLACHIEQRAQGTLQELRGLGQSYASQSRGVFVGVLQDPPSLLVAASEDSGIDAAALIRGALGASGGRGGGTAR